MSKYVSSLGKKGDPCPDCKKPVFDRWGTGHEKCKYPCPDCGFELSVRGLHFGWSPQSSVYCGTCFHEKHCGPKCTFGKHERRRLGTPSRWD